MARFFTFLFALALLLGTAGCALLDEEEPPKSEYQRALEASCFVSWMKEENSDKVAVCHNSTSGDMYTLLVSETAARAHALHGDALGGCLCDEQPATAALTSDDDHDDDDDGEDATDLREDGDYCDSDQRRCHHNWGCPESQLCDAGCCVDVVRLPEVHEPAIEDYVH